MRHYRTQPQAASHVSKIELLQTSCSGQMMKCRGLWSFSWSNSHGKFVFTVHNSTIFITLIIRGLIGCHMVVKPQLFDWTASWRIDLSFCVF